MRTQGKGGVVRQLFDNITAAMRQAARALPGSGKLTQILTLPSRGRSARLDPVTNLTPHGLASALKQAIEGRPLDYLRIAADMEEKDPHYASVLATRKMAVASLEPQIIPGGTSTAGSDDTRAQEIAAQLGALVQTPLFEALLLDLLDGLGKGWSVCEIIWKHEALWTPERFAHVAPHWFRIDPQGQNALLLIDAEGREAAPLTPFKFITHIPRFRSGSPLRGGLARLAAWSYLYKAYAVKDWLAFIEIYGLPLRIGRYGPEASPEDIATLDRAVIGLGHNVAATLPQGMDIEFVAAGAAGRGGGAGTGPGPFQAMAEWVDRQVSKAVLGQTMTTDDGASRAQAEVHDKVRRDILRADARQLAATLNRDLVRPFVELNFGPQEMYPRLALPLPEARDIPALTSALQVLVPMGMQVDAAATREMLGLPAPTDEGEALHAPHQAPAPDSDTDEASHHSLRSRQFGLRPHGSAGAPQGRRAPVGALWTSDDVTGARQEARSLLAANAEDTEDIDELEETALATWEDDFEPVIKPVQTAIEGAASWDEALARLDEAAGDMDSGQLARRLGEASFKARGLGDISD